MTASGRGNEIWIVETAKESANCWSVEQTGSAAQTTQTGVSSNGTTEIDLLWTIGRGTDLQAVPTLAFPAPRPAAPFRTPLQQLHPPLLLLFLPRRTGSQTNNSKSNDRNTNNTNNINSNFLLLFLLTLLPLLSPIKPANHLWQNLVVMLTDQSPYLLVPSRRKTFLRLLSALLPRLLRKCPHLAQ